MGKVRKRFYAASMDEAEICQSWGGNKDWQCRGEREGGGGGLENSSAVFTGKKKVLYCASNHYTDEANHALEIIVPSLTAEVHAWLRPETSVLERC